MIRTSIKVGPFIWTPSRPKQRPPASRASNRAALVVLGIVITTVALCAGIGAFL